MECYYYSFVPLLNLGGDVNIKIIEYFSIGELIFTKLVSKIFWLLFGRVSILCSGHKYDFKRIQESAQVLSVSKTLNGIIDTSFSILHAVVLTLPNSIGQSRTTTILANLGNCLTNGALSSLKEFSLLVCGPPPSSQLDWRTFDDICIAAERGYLRHLVKLNLCAPYNSKECRGAFFQIVCKECPILREISSFDSWPYPSIISNCSAFSFLSDLCWSNLIHLEIGMLFHTLLEKNFSDETYQSIESAANLLCSMLTSDRFPSVNSISIHVESSEYYLPIFKSFFDDWFGDKDFFGPQIKMLQLEQDTLYIYDIPGNDLLWVELSRDVHARYTLDADKHVIRSSAQIPKIFPSLQKLVLKHWMPSVLLLQTIGCDHSSSVTGGDGDRISSALQLEASPGMQDHVFADFFTNAWSHETLPLSSLLLRGRERVIAINAYNRLSWDEDTVEDDGDGGGDSQVTDWRVDCTVLERNLLAESFSGSAMDFYSDRPAPRQHIVAKSLYLSISTGKFMFLTELQVTDIFLVFVKSRALPLVRCRSLRRCNLTHENERSTRINLETWLSLVKGFFAAVEASREPFPPALQLIDVAGFSGAAGKSFRSSLRHAVSRYFIETSAGNGQLVQLRSGCGGVVHVLIRGTLMLNLNDLTS